MCVLAVHSVLAACSKTLFHIERKYNLLFFKLWFYGKLHAKAIFIIKARCGDFLEFLLAALLDSRNSWYLGKKQFGI